MRVELEVDAAPPIRSDPGRSADRHSPGARPLAEVAKRLKDREPSRFPIAGPIVLTLRLGSAAPETSGYEIEDPILEVLADVGLIVDERQLNTVHESRDDSRQDYSIIIESA